jgi:hypothetical protein
MKGMCGGVCSRFYVVAWENGGGGLLNKYCRLTNFILRARIGRTKFLTKNYTLIEKLEWVEQQKELMGKWPSDLN